MEQESKICVEIAITDSFVREGQCRDYKFIMQCMGDHRGHIIFAWFL